MKFKRVPRHPSLKKTKKPPKIKKLSDKNAKLKKTKLKSTLKKENKISKKTEFILDNISDNKHCTHGPRILKEVCSKEGYQRSYTCSAFRGEEKCKEYLVSDINQCPEKDVEEIEKAAAAKHQALFERLQKAKEGTVSFCKTCETIVLEDEMYKHSTCKVIELKERDVEFPVKLFSAKTDPKKESQLHFSDSTVSVVIQLIQSLGVKRVLCIGAPMIHQALKKEEDMNSLLLDIDDRYCRFFSPDEFLLYNMYNHYFFAGDKGKKVYMDFLKTEEKTLVLIDPPFGGKIELLTRSLKLIQKDTNGGNDTNEKQLPVIAFFPHFFEKDQIPKFRKHFPTTTMLEYLVQYSNFPNKAGKQPSVVRMFATEAASLFKLPDSEGYKFCEFCNRWTHAKNVHCFKCRDCTSKSGDEYRHCATCNTCVKAKWKHCKECNVCLSNNHNCELYKKSQRQKRKRLEEEKKAETKKAWELRSSKIVEEINQYEEVKETADPQIGKSKKQLKKKTKKAKVEVEIPMDRETWRCKREEELRQLRTDLRAKLSAHKGKKRYKSQKGKARFAKWKEEMQDVVKEIQSIALERSKMMMLDKRAMKKQKLALAEMGQTPKKRKISKN